MPEAFAEELRRAYRAGFSDGVRATDLGVKSYYVEDWKVACCERALLATEGDENAAAKLAGLDVRTLRRRIGK